MRLARILQVCLIFGYAGMTTHASEDNLVVNNFLHRTIFISNDHTTEDVRCQFILAHFVTYDFVKFSQNDTLSIPVYLSNSDGTIFYFHAGNYMAIEDLLCGFDADWALTRQELSLIPFISSIDESLHFICGGDQMLSCIRKSIEY